MFDKCYFGMIIYTYHRQQHTQKNDVGIPICFILSLSLYLRRGLPISCNCTWRFLAIFHRSTKQYDQLILTETAWRKYLYFLYHFYQITTPLRLSLDIWRPQIFLVLFLWQVSRCMIYFLYCIKYSNYGMTDAW